MTNGIKVSVPFGGDVDWFDLRENLRNEGLFDFEVSIETDTVYVSEWDYPAYVVAIENLGYNAESADEQGEEQDHG